MLLGPTPFQCTLKLLNPNETMLSVNKALLQQSVAYNLIIMGPLKKAVVERNCKAIQTEVKSNKKEKGPLQWCATRKLIALTAVNDSL